MKRKAESADTRDQKILLAIKTFEADMKRATRGLSRCLKNKQKTTK